MRVKTERLKMSKQKGLTLRAISIVVTMLVMAGTFVAGYHTLQYRVAKAEEQIEDIDKNVDGCVRDLKKDVESVKIDVGRMQTDIKALKEDVKDNNKYVRNRLDYIIEELSKQVGATN